MAANRSNSITVLSHPVGGYVASVRFGIITIPIGEVSATSTLNEFDLANSIAFYGGGTTNNTGTDPSFTDIRVELTDSTTATAYRAASHGTFTTSIRFFIVTFIPGVIKSKQAGVITHTAAATATATITAVDTAKSICLFNGFTTDDTTLHFERMPRVELTNATTVTSTSASAKTGTTGFMVIEFTPHLVRSIQTVLHTSSSTDEITTATINDVDTGLSMCLYNGAGSAGTIEDQSMVYLSGKNTVSFQCYNAASARFCAATVVQFERGFIKSVQHVMGTLINTIFVQVAMIPVNKKAILPIAGVMGQSGTIMRAYTVNTNLGTAPITMNNEYRVTSNIAGSTTRTCALEVIDFH